MWRVQNSSELWALDIASLRAGAGPIEGQTNREGAIRNEVC